MNANAPAQGRTADPRQSRWMAAFTRLWAMAHLIHLGISTDQQIVAPTSIATAILAVVVLHHPRSRVAVPSLMVVQVVDFFWHAPASPDHWLLVAFINVTILLTMLARRTSGVSSLVAALPAIRVITLVAYSAAAIAKYNHTFLDGPVSCATWLASRATFGLSDGLPLDLLWPLFSIAVETVVPLLLAFPATRRHGVRLGMTFHLLITLSPVVQVDDYSAVLYALFFLFLGPADVDRLLDRLQNLADRSMVAKLVHRRSLGVSVVALLLIATSGHVFGTPASIVGAVLATVYLAVICTAALTTWRTTCEPRPIGRIRAGQAPLLVIVLAWCLSPYLGLHTQPAFTMFSSLRTEGEVGNHLFMPTWRLTSWQDDLVYLSSYRLDGVEQIHDAPGTFAAPLMRLRQDAVEAPSLEVEGTLHGDPVSFGQGPNQQPWEEPPLAGHLITFRRIDASGQLRYCTN